MQTLTLAEIVIGERQRKEFEAKDIQILKASILQKGLLHPIVITQNKELVAGERRLRAITELHEEGQTFQCDGVDVELGSIPYTSVGELTEDDLCEAELEENLLRVNLTWQEETKAKALIAELRAKTYPEQTLKQTAQEIIDKTGKGTVASVRSDLSKARLIVKHLDDPRVANAKNQHEAYKNVLLKNEAAFKARLATVSKLNINEYKVINGDCLAILPTLPDRSINTIISDPPYGISADKMKKDALHLYDDSPDTALEINKTIIREGFRITTNQALLFLFCDFNHFNHLRDYASCQGWVPWRVPVIWKKGTHGHAPWGQAGFIRTYETILFAVKGQKALVLPGGPDILDFKRPSKTERVHAAEKPTELLKFLISISCIAGDTVLDPCCGSGSIIDAAKQSKVKVIAVEKDPEYYNLALARLTSEPDDESESESQIDTLLGD